MHMKNANKLTCTGLLSLFKTMYNTFIISQTVFQDYNKIHVDKKTKSSYAYQELSLAERISKKKPTKYLHCPKTRRVTVDEESIVLMRQ